MDVRKWTVAEFLAIDSKINADGKNKFQVGSFWATSLSFKAMDVLFVV